MKKNWKGWIKSYICGKSLIKIKSEKRDKKLLFWKILNSTELKIGLLKSLQRKNINGTWRTRSKRKLSGRPKTVSMRPLHMCILMWGNCTEQKFIKVLWHPMFDWRPSQSKWAKQTMKICQEKQENLLSSSHRMSFFLAHCSSPILTWKQPLSEIITKVIFLWKVATDSFVCDIF